VTDDLPRLPTRLDGCSQGCRPRHNTSQNQTSNPGAYHGFCYGRPVGHFIGYARVSTADQNPALQLDALNAASCLKVYTDRASGAAAERPELARALDDLRPGDTLVVWRLDRLGRSLRHLVEIVTQLEERKVGLRSLSESIDTTSPSGKLVFHIFCSLAEFERALLRERTAAGLAAARARGRLGGRPRALTPR
jgi:DNA invertase Pin-like site-specific DNA recombinase